MRRRQGRDLLDIGTIGLADLREHAHHYGKAIETHMPVALLLPILLRAAGPAAFILSAMTAGVLNQSIVLIPLLALAATITTILIRKLSPSPAADLAAMLNPDAPQQPKSIFAGSAQRFGIGLIGYAVCFGLAALIAALFQETEFNQTLVQSDIWFALIPAAIALIGASLSARMGANQMADMAGQMQAMFAQMQAQQGQDNPQDDDAFTVEGEIIDKDEN
ncbi:MAG: hypothetical protein AAGJ85_02350 [Pseudomonadota bacterium]